MHDPLERRRLAGLDRSRPDGIFGDWVLDSEVGVGTLPLVALGAL